MRYRQVALMILVAVALGLLEAAWTTPEAPGATRAGLGCIAIGIVMAVVCWPRLWWAFGLSMLEEATQVFVGSYGAWRPNSDWLFHHWSAGYFGINLYPVISFTLITIAGEIGYQWWRKSRHAASNPSPPVPVT